MQRRLVLTRAAALLFSLSAGCATSVSVPVADPPAPTPLPVATHPPAFAPVSRPSPSPGDRPASPVVPLPSPSPSPSPSSSSSSAAAAVASTRARAAPVVYVAIGASETVGVGASDPSRDGWVPQLAQLLGPATRLSNLGVSGTLLSSALKEQLPVALHDQPDLVTVWLAVNDLDAHVPLDRYTADLDTLLTSLARQTSARILVGSVPDLAHVPAYQAAEPVALQAEVSRWNTAIAQVAGRHGAVVVDLYAGYAELGQHPEYISGDGFHPSTAGYTRIAEMFYAAARRVLPE